MIRISSGNSFVHQTESRAILNGSRQIDFTMDVVLKHISPYRNLAQQADVPLELRPLVIRLLADGLARYDSRAQSDEITRSGRGERNRHSRPRFRRS